MTRRNNQITEELRKMTPDQRVYLICGGDKRIINLVSRMMEMSFAAGMNSAQDLNPNKTVQTRFTEWMERPGI